MKYFTLRHFLMISSGFYDTCLKKDDYQAYQERIKTGSGENILN